MEQVGASAREIANEQADANAVQIVVYAKMDWKRTDDWYCLRTGTEKTGLLETLGWKGRDAWSAVVSSD